MLTNERPRDLGKVCAEATVEREECRPEGIVLRKRRAHADRTFMLPRAPVG